MSFRRSNAIGRGVRPAQVFKKRNNLFGGATVLSNADAVLISEIVLRETGTIYAIKISSVGIALASVSGDHQLIRLWVRCVPAVTPLPDLTSAVELDTMNGFLVGAYLFSQPGQPGTGQTVNEKFRFRRKCDENSLLQLLAQSTNTNGSGRTVELSGVMSAVIRVK